MSIYRRYKTQPGGFRNLVALLETTPPERRQKMIDAGMAEDPKYTQKAMQYMMNFDDVLHLTDSELAEVVNKAPARALAYAVQDLPEETQQRFVLAALPKLRGEVVSILEEKGSGASIQGAQYKLIAIARDLERRGYVKAKVIPEVP